MSSFSAVYNVSKTIISHNKSNHRNNRKAIKGDVVAFAYHLAWITMRCANELKLLSAANSIRCATSSSPKDNYDLRVCGRSFGNLTAHRQRIFCVSFYAVQTINKSIQTHTHAHIKHTQTYARAYFISFPSPMKFHLRISDEAKINWWRAIHVYLCN